MELEKYLKEKNKFAIAFSGGTDSAYLLYAAMKAGCDVRAYYVFTEFQPAFELADARRFAAEFNADMKFISLSMLDKEICTNDKMRCYYCKKKMFSAIAEAANADGYSILADGTNASDDVTDRPGYKAGVELAVISPLRECGLDKEEIRKRSKEARLFTWNKPSYSCLATRIKEGQAITEDDLETTERAENSMYLLGFTDFRLRMIKEQYASPEKNDKIKRTVFVELRNNQRELLESRKEEVVNVLLEYYDDVAFDTGDVK